jgi:hypothetical protein
MVSKSQARALMLIASIAGAVQGLLSFLGGCVATYDKHKDLDSNTISVWVGIGDMKYYCGYMKLKRAPTNIGKSNEDCDTDFSIMDRGWYSRVHKHCLECHDEECDAPACDLSGFGVVLAYAIVCGVGWSVIAVAAFISFILNHKKTGIVVTVVYIIVYIIFIGLFAAVWSSAKKMDRECLNKACKEVRNQGKRSSREVLAYFICSFITIFGAIICSLIAIGGLGKPAERDKKKDANNDKDMAAVKDFKKGKAYYEPNVIIFEEGKDNGKDYKLGIIGQEFIYKFNQLNNYIADKSKLHKYAEKKFRQADTENTGTLVLDNVRNCMAKLMHRKELPFPSEDRLNFLMRRYDTSESNKLEKSEFEQLLYDIFMESRDLLIDKYAIKKANSWMFDKTNATMDIPKLRELDELLSNTEDFDDALGKAVVSAGKNASSTFSVDEVAEIAKVFSEKYNVQILTNQEITEIMREMGKGISEYDANDLRMAIYAVLCISKNLIR